MSLQSDRPKNTLISRKGNVQNTERSKRRDIILKSGLSLEHPIAEMYLNGCSIYYIANAYGSSRGMMWRIITRGQFPKSPELRKRLDLPILHKIPECPECNKIHTRICRPTFKKRIESVLSKTDTATVLFFYEWIKKRGKL